MNLQRRAQEGLAQRRAVGGVVAGAARRRRSARPAATRAPRTNSAERIAAVAAEAAVEVELLDGDAERVALLELGVEVHVPGEDVGQVEGELVLLARRRSTAPKRLERDRARGRLDADVVAAGHDLGREVVAAARHAQRAQLVDAVGEGARAGRRGRGRGRRDGRPRGARGRRRAARPRRGWWTPAGESAPRRARRQVRVAARSCRGRCDAERLRRRRPPPRRGPPIEARQVGGQQEEGEGAQGAEGASSDQRLSIRTRGRAGQGLFPIGLRRVEAARPRSRPSRRRRPGSTRASGRVTVRATSSSHDSSVGKPGLRRASIRIGACECDRWLRTTVGRGGVDVGRGLEARERGPEEVHRAPRARARLVGEDERAASRRRPGARRVRSAGLGLVGEARARRPRGSRRRRPAPR